MMIHFKAGGGKVKLTKREWRTLKDAYDLVALIDNATSAGYPTTDFDIQIHGDVLEMLDDLVKFFEPAEGKRNGDGSDADSRASVVAAGGDDGRKADAST